MKVSAQIPIASSAQQCSSSLINYFIVSIKDVVIVRIIISSRRIKNPKQRQHKRKNDTPRYQYVCVYYTRFIRLGHAHIAELPRNGVRLGVGAALPQAQGCHCARQMARTQASEKGKGTLCKQIAGAPSLSATKLVCVTSLCAVDATRRRLFCEIAR